MEIADYRDRIAEHRPCGEGLEEFLEARTRHDVFLCMMDGMNTDFFLESVRDGWGPSGEDVLRIFDRHVNGYVTREGASMWCNYSGKITPAPEVRRIVLLDCGDVEIEMPERTRYAKIQMAGDDCRLLLKGRDTTFVQVRRYSGSVRSEGVDAKIYDR